MPRNPNKRPCQQPGCRNWAMRDHLLCRSHLDHELGPRGAGAPIGNINAWKHGRNISPNTLKNLRALAYKLYEQPECLQDEIAWFVNAFYNHGQTETIPRTLKALVSLRSILDPLIDFHAEVHFRADVEELLSHAAPESAANIQRRIWEAAVHHRPFESVVNIRKSKARLIDEKNPPNQLPVPPFHPEKETQK